MAHIAVGFFTLGLLSVVLSYPAWFTPLLVLPVLLSALIMRFRTVADERTVRVRTLFGSRSIDWDEIDGLRFGKGAWAFATLDDGSEVRLPAVTFSTLPRLAEASGGRVPNPYD
jgi:hypothetical protein